MSNLFLFFKKNLLSLLLSLLFLLSNSVFSQSIKPLRNYTFDQVAENEEVNYLIIEGCVSLYSAMTELTKEQYPDMASQFFKIANTIYPYGIISLQRIKSLSNEQAEKEFFQKVNSLTNRYVYEMNETGNKTGSFFEGSFFGEDLKFCQEVTSSLYSLIKENFNNSKD